MTPLARRIGAVLPVVAALAALAGCAQKEADTATKDTTPPAGSAAPTAQFTGGTLKVALITPGPISDTGWNGPAYQGLQRIKKDLGAEVAQVESHSQAEFGGLLTQFAQKGYNLVFAHGSEFDDAAKEAAAKFPKTVFIVTGGRSAGPNLDPIAFRADQVTYQAGMLAAGMSKTGKIGLIGGQKIPIIQQTFAAFTRGAKAVKPDITVTTTYTGDEKDAAKAKQQAQALLDAGADVLMQNADEAGKGVFQAVKDKPGAMIIGANSDQSDLAPEQTLGSFILKVPDAIFSAAKALKDGKLDGKPFQAGEKEGAVDFTYNPRFLGTIPADLKAKIAKAKADIIAGTLDTAK